MEHLNKNNKKTILETPQFKVVRSRTEDDITAMALLAVKIANTFPNKKIQINKNKKQNINLFTLFLGESTKAKKSSISKLVKPVFTIPLGSGEAMSDLPNGATGTIMIDEIQRSFLPKIKNENATLQSWLCRVWDDGTNFQFAVRKRSANGEVKELNSEVKKVHLSFCGQGIRDMFFNNLPDVIKSSGLLWRFLFIPIEGKVKHYSDFEYFIEGKGNEEVGFSEEASYVNEDFGEFNDEEINILIDDEVREQGYFEELFNIGETAHAIRSKDMMFRVAGALAVLKGGVADKECFEYAKEIVINSINYLNKSFRDENPDEQFILEYLEASEQTGKFAKYSALFMAFTRENKDKESWQTAIYSLMGLDKYGRLDQSIEPKIEKFRENNKTYYKLINETSSNNEEPLDLNRYVKMKSKTGETFLRSIPPSISKERAKQIISESSTEEEIRDKMVKEMFGNVSTTKIKNKPEPQKIEGKVDDPELDEFLTDFGKNF